MQAEESWRTEGPDNKVGVCWEMWYWGGLRASSPEGMGGEVMGLRTEMLTAGVLNGLSTVYKKS